MASYEHRVHVLIDPAAKDANRPRLGLVDVGSAASATDSKSALRNTMASPGNEIRYFVIRGLLCSGGTFRQVASAAMLQCTARFGISRGRPVKVMARKSHAACRFAAAMPNTRGSYPGVFALANGLP
jgi:hypothetical protein